MGTAIAFYSARCGCAASWGIMMTWNGLSEGHSGSWTIRIYRPGIIQLERSLPHSDNVFYHCSVGY